MATLISFIVGSMVAVGSDARLEDIRLFSIERKIDATVYAYTASHSETDEAPNENASGEVPKVGDVANNCLPFGSLVHVDGKIYEVKDRMNKRYGCEVFDIFMSSRERAKIFGKRSSQVYILGDHERG